MYTADDDERTVLGGPAWDGGITCFLNPHDDFLFGPYHSQCPDVCPAVEYPRQLVFQPVDRRDLLRLFEDGYRDCARWVEAGCRSRQAERKDLILGGGLRVLIREGCATFLEVCGIREKRA